MRLIVWCLLRRYHIVKVEDGNVVAVMRKTGGCTDRPEPDVSVENNSDTPTPCQCAKSKKALDSRNIFCPCLVGRPKSFLVPILFQS
jgi:hypothetical protein